MTPFYATVFFALLLGIGVLQILLLRRRAGVDLEPVLQALQAASERTERVLREEIARNREESNLAAREARTESAANLKAFGDTFNQQLAGSAQQTHHTLETLREGVERRLNQINQDSGAKLENIRAESQAAAQKARDEVTTALTQFKDHTLGTLRDLGAAQRTHLGDVVSQITRLSNELTRLTDANQQKFDKLREALEAKLKAIQEDNANRLEQMRATVDEKLQGTLEKRLGESFKQVSDRLEQVYRGLGEMQTLATGVGDLKKVLTNVKSRGTWGEVQLGAMLEQVLAPDQYAMNVATKDSGNRVEFALKLPGRGEDRSECVWLPIDAKFPVEDYQRLLEAQERADPEGAEEAAKQLEVRLKHCAKEICEKYISPPKTTDFGILYLPTEGLFAEVIRRTGLPEYVQRECRIVIAGPTTLWSILNSLQMGFKTLAIQKRSSEVWNVLGAVKTEFGKFGDLLDGVKKKLDSASSTIDDAARKSRTIERRLKTVQELPTTDAATILQLAPEDLEAGELPGIGAN